jgi:hypothetical protein
VSIASLTRQSKREPVLIPQAHFEIRRIAPVWVVTENPPVVATSYGDIDVFRFRDAQDSVATRLLRVGDLHSRGNTLR